MKSLFGSVAFVAMVIVTPIAANALVIGQSDTFQDGTTDNWTAGGPGGQMPPTPPFVMPTGGPAGLGDQFLVITSIGCPIPAICDDPTSPPGTGTPGAALNRRAQWAGDYLSSGISAISMIWKISVARR